MKKIPAPPPTRALRLGLAALVAAAIAAACDEASTPLTPADEASSPAESRQAASWTATAQGESMTELTRAVALALGHQGLRTRVLQDMRRAPYLEHKLDFSSYLRGESGGILRAAMRNAAELSGSEIHELLDAAPELEFYMPVVEHRRTWTGGDEVVVASGQDDEDRPVGFDTSGESVPLEVDAPPETPVFVLVPSETDFSSPINPLNYANRDDAGGEAIGQYERGSALRAVEEPIQPDPDPGDGSLSPRVEWDEQPPGIFLDRAWYESTEEAWTKGSPELEVLTMAQEDGSSEATVEHCVADHLSGSQYYEQNDKFWKAGTTDGVPQIATDDQVAGLPEDRGFVFLVIEDDDGRCEPRRDDDLLTEALETVQAIRDGLDAIDKADSDLDGVLAIAESLVEIVPGLVSLISTNDDPLGYIEEESCTDPNGSTYSHTVMLGDRNRGCVDLKGNY